MTIAHVQGNSAQAFGGAGVSGSLMQVTISAVGSGNSLVGVVSGGVGSGQTLTSITDDKGNTYTILDSSVATGAGFATYTFALGNITNGPSTITANWSASVNNWGLAVDEFSGTLANSNPIDNSGASHIGNFQTAPGTGANGATSTAITTVANGCAIWGATIDHSGTANNATAGTGFTLAQTMSIKGITEYLIQSTAGSIAATATLSAVQTQFTAMIALAPAGGGGGGLRPLLLPTRRIFVRR
jgi:hypothetical protein